jgi:hypothetical protein
VKACYIYVSIELCNVLNFFTNWNEVVALGMQCWKGTKIKDCLCWPIGAWSICAG